MITFWQTSKVELIQSPRELPQCFSSNLVSLRKMKSLSRLSALNFAKSRSIKELRNRQPSLTCGTASEIWASLSPETFQIWAKRAVAALPEPQPLSILARGMRKKKLKGRELIKRRKVDSLDLSLPIISKKYATCSETQSSNQTPLSTSNNLETILTMKILRFIEVPSRLKSSIRPMVADTFIWKYSKFLIQRKMEAKVPVMVQTVLEESKLESKAIGMRMWEQLLMRHWKSWILWLQMSFWKESKLSKWLLTWWRRVSVTLRPRPSLQILLPQIIMNRLSSIS